MLNVKEPRKQQQEQQSDPHHDFTTKKLREGEVYPPLPQTHTSKEQGSTTTRHASVRSDEPTQPFCTSHRDPACLQPWHRVKH